MRIVIALFVVLLFVGFSKWINKENNKQLKFLEKIKGQVCKHKTIAGEFVVIGMNFADNSVIVRCTDGTLQKFAYDELIMPI